MLPRPTPGPVRGTVPAALLLTLLLILGAGALLLRGLGQGSAALDRAGVEAFLGLPLPPGTRSFDAVTEAGIDRLVRARFEAPEAEAAAFARALTGAEPRPGLDPGVTAFAEGLAAGPLADWPRAPPPRFAGAEAHAAAANRSLKLLVVPSPASSGLVVVYLVAFSL